MDLLANSTGYIMDQQTSDDLMLCGRLQDIAQQYGCELTNVNLDDMDFAIVGEKSYEAGEAILKYLTKVSGGNPDERIRVGRTGEGSKTLQIIHEKINSGDSPDKS